MDIRARLTILTAVFGGALAVVTGAKLGVIFYVIIFTVFLSLMVAHLHIESNIKKKILVKSLGSVTFTRFYKLRMLPVTRWPRDWRCLDFSLKLAAFYPLGILIFWWALTGNESKVGNLSVFPADSSDSIRLLKLLSLALITVGVFFGKVVPHQSKHPKNSLRYWMHQRLIAVGLQLLGIAILGLLIVFSGIGSAFAMGAGVGALFVLMGLVATIWVTGPVYATGAAAFAGTAGLAIAVSGASAAQLDTQSTIFFGAVAAFVPTFLVGSGVNTALKKVSGNVLFVIYATSVVIVLLCAIRYMNWPLVSDSAKSFFLFVALLPLLNATFDFFSYIATLYLISIGVLKLPRFSFLIWVFDLWVAVILFAFSGISLIALITFVNYFSNSIFLDANALFLSIKKSPKEYTWLYLMLFSAIVPTLIHAIVASFSFASILSRRLRRTVVIAIESTDAWFIFFAPLKVGMIYWVMCAFPAFMVYLIYYSLSVHGNDTVAIYMNYLEFFSKFTGLIH